VPEGVGDFVNAAGVAFQNSQHMTTTEKYLQSLGVEDLQAVHDKLSLLNPAR
jgi:hypothetical protein